MTIQDINNINDKSMIIKDLNAEDIIRDKKINSLFLSVANSNLRIGCIIVPLFFWA